jgi:hypothetical protein
MVWTFNYEDIFNSLKEAFTHAHVLRLMKLVFCIDVIGDNIGTIIKKEGLGCDKQIKKIMSCRIKLPYLG